jgi:hypothetical protein
VLTQSQQSWQRSCADKSPVSPACGVLPLACRVQTSLLAVVYSLACHLLCHLPAIYCVTCLPCTRSTLSCLPSTLPNS